MKTTAEPSLTTEDKKRAHKHSVAMARRPSHTLRARLEDTLQRAQRRAILDAVDFQPDQNVIDVGAGLGYVARAAKNAGAHVTALDVIPETAQRLAGVADEVIIDDIERFRTDRVFDRVLFIGVLDFVVKPREAIVNVCRLVAPGGRLLMLVSTKSLIGQLYRAEKFLHGVRVNLFEPAWCLEVTQEAGLETVSVTRPQRNNALIVCAAPKKG